MRGAPRESATLFNMIDGIFAVAITLSPTALPSSLNDESRAQFAFVSITLLLIALTMLLLWLKLRTIVQLKEKLAYTDVILIAAILMVAVLIPRSGYLAIKLGHLEGSLWAWNDSQRVNVEYQGLLLFVEAALLALSWRTMKSPKAKIYPRALRRWVLGTEILGLVCLLVLVIADNLIVGINGLYIYAITVILLLEEGLCLARMKVFERSAHGVRAISGPDNHRRSS